MPNIQYPNKGRKGYVAARRCTAPCGGWVVLLDRKAGGPEGLKQPIRETGRWILQHDPSGKWAGLDKKEQALQYLTAVAKGEDGEVGILPTTVPPLPGTEILPRTKKRRKQGNPPSPGSESDPARVREAATEAALPVPGSAPPPPPPAASLPGPVVFQRELDERFPADVIADGLEEGLKAEKAY
ncbi:MAG TPA: hypothetical protein VK956_12325, partial [Verrucomicrobium sp.]|nr:hypothetical protein [Verrucomicrobium sp.]